MNRLTRPPPCSRCGLVESAMSYGHQCHPFHLIAMKVGVEQAVRIGRAIVLAFASMKGGPEHVDGCESVVSASHCGCWRKGGVQ